MVRAREVFRHTKRSSDWEDFGRKVLQAKTLKLETLVAKGVDRFEYTYDFGDN
jgi:hypothetical protein